jgi:hypothetical protein
VPGCVGAFGQLAKPGDYTQNPPAPGSISVIGMFCQPTWDYIWWYTLPQLELDQDCPAPCCFALAHLAVACATSSGVTPLLFFQTI